MIILRILKVMYLAYMHIDECEEGARRILLDRFRSLQCDNSIRVGNRIKIIITSRPHVDVELYLPDVVIIGLDSDNSNLNNDIADFVTAEASKLARFPVTLKEEIRHALINGADGMFLWVSLVIDDLQKSTSTRSRIIRQKLKSLPKTLPELYTDILGKIKSDDREYATAILRWVVWAVRPLTLQELTIAIAIRPEDTSMSSLEGEMELDLSKVLRLLFGPMINIRGDGVHLVHQSAKDFLRHAQFAEGSSHHSGFLSCLRATESNLQLAVSCLTYLSFDEFEEGPVNASYGWGYLRTRRQEGQFLGYAATNWSEHMTQISQEMQENDDLRTAFSRVAASSRKSYLTFTFSRHMETTSLEIAARLGFVVFAKDILDGGADVNAQGSYYGNALQVAAYYGNEAVVRLLVVSGADVNARSGYYGNALYATVSKGNEALVRLLVDNGADVNAQGGEYGNALQAAAYCGTEAMVRLLVNSEADVNAQGGVYGNALQAAVYYSNEAVVRLLVDSGANVNAQGGIYGNALLAAVSKRSEAVLRLLVDSGADVNAQGGKYGNALQAAVYYSNEAVVRLLMDSGADVNAQGGIYGNALLAAVSKRREAVHRLLVDSGADVNAQGGEFGNALQAAAYYGNEAVVRLLVNSGADVNAQGGKFGNALQAAAYYGTEAVVRLLVDSGANVNAQGGIYGNALLAAVSKRSEAVLRLLVDSGADVNAQGSIYSNALLAAVSEGNEAVVRLLMDSGADVNA
jgi:ankyrin repeat protein